MKVTFLLKIRDAAALERKFWTVSDPTHADYQNYMTLEEISDFVRPSQANTDALLAWFHSHSITEYTTVPNGDAYTVTIPVRTVEAMLNVYMERFEIADSHVMSSVHRAQFRNYRVLRSVRQYSIPAHLRDVIQVVAGLNNFPSARPVLSGAMARREAQLAKETITTTDSALQSSFWVTPTVIYNELNIPTGTVGKASNNLQAVAQFLEQYYAPSDLQAFQSYFNTPAQVVAKTIGNNIASQPGGEASLDIQYIMGTGQGVPTWFFYTSGLHDGQEPFVEWATNLNAMSTIPQVNSVSYGDYENTLSTTFMDRLDVELQKLAVRGSSILFASGDDGVGCNAQCTKFVANYPASSPYVTAVGGVTGGRNSGFAGDTIASGGFSSYYPMPDYQKSAVQSYLSSMGTAGNLPQQSYYNRSNRAIPDVAAYSENVLVFISGIVQPIGGTSCASPIVAGLVSLLNDKLLTAGKKPLGFLNPLLYSTYKTQSNIFSPVTSGSNAQGCCPGFQANPNGGWCPITGMGVPNFVNLAAAIAKTFNL